MPELLCPTIVSDIINVTLLTLLSVIWKNQVDFYLSSLKHAVFSAWHHPSHLSLIDFFSFLYLKVHFFRKTVTVHMIKSISVCLFILLHMLHFSLKL